MAGIHLLEAFFNRKRKRNPQAEKQLFVGYDFAPGGQLTATPIANGVQRRIKKVTPLLLLDVTGARRLFWISEFNLDIFHQECRTAASTQQKEIDHMTDPIESIHSTVSGKNSRIRRLLRYSSVLVALAFALFAVPASRAVDPPPGGGYPGDNTALGDDALFSLTTGTDNVALGHEALFSTTTGLNNTATGDDALAANVVGFNNTAHGWHALKQTTGNENTGVGCDAITNITTGSENVALGYRAGVNLMTGSNNIVIGNNGVFDESNTIRIGTTGVQTATFIAGIRSVPVTGGQQVGVAASGQLGVRASSARFKEAISSMDKSSKAIMALRPVSFRYKKELDPKGVPQFGLVAEEVAKVNPDLVTPDEQGKPFTVRYEEINVMLLNEFLKEHRTVQQQQKEIDALKAELKEQRALIQKVNDKVEFNKPAPRVTTGD